MRPTRTFYRDGYYHLIIRSNQPVFQSKKDFVRYINNLDKYSIKFSAKVLAFALMPNHIHLLVQQTSDLQLSKFIQVLNTAYVKYFNLKYKRYGSLFQSHFKALLIESDEYLIHVSRYIHLNPSSSSLVVLPEDYLWSSYRTYLGLENLEFVDKETILNYFSVKNKIRDYKEFINERINYQRKISLQKLLSE